MGDDRRDADTLRALDSGEPERRELPALICLTVLYHPSPVRVGDRALLLEQENKRALRLSRNELEFVDPRGGRRADTLADPYLSRAAIELTAGPDGLVLELPARAGVLVDGARSHGRIALGMDRLASGVVLALAKRVVLLAHLTELGPRPPDYGLTGESPSMRAVRRSISRVGDLDVPVLIRGETGVGKERVAEAIHVASGRRGPCVAINVATLAPTLAASELFGHAKGAFTGASERKAGLFEQADGGTLFLDEIGELSADVQPMLLRALETGSVRRVGEHEERPVSTRIVAATDADLETAVERGTFRAALYHRLRGFEIVVPPLRERREDIPRLVVSFLVEALSHLGEGDADAPPWIDRELMIRLVRHDWPGNVRQLRGVIRQLVISSRGEPTLRADASVERALRSDLVEAADERRSAAEIPKAEVVETLRAHRFSIGKAARALGITRSALYRLAQADGELRTASDVDRNEIEALIKQHEGDLDRVADALRISPRALRLRLRALGID